MKLNRAPLCYEISNHLSHQMAGGREMMQMAADRFRSILEVKGSPCLKCSHVKMEQEKILMNDSTRVSLRCSVPERSCPEVTKEYAAAFSPPLPPTRPTNYEPFATYMSDRDSVIRGKGVEKVWLDELSELPSLTKSLLRPPVTAFAPAFSRSQKNKDLPINRQSDVW